MFFVIGVVATAIGLICLFRQEWMWQLTRWGNEWEGQAPERTALWETRTTISGMVFIAVGIGSIILGLTR